jgi:hypothetical protein
VFRRACFCPIVYTVLEGHKKLIGYPMANAILVPKECADRVMDAAAMHKFLSRKTHPFFVCWRTFALESSGSGVV